MKRYLHLASIALLLSASISRSVAFERKPFDRSRFAQAEAAGKQAVAAAATESPASATAAPAAVKPTPAFVELFGKSLLTDKGKKADLTELNGKTVALYFSASWCPPCRAFSPLLVDLAKKLQSGGKPFVIVLVGCDQTEQKALAYMKDHKMPGYLVPPEADENKALCKRYGVSGIPKLVIIDSHGDAIDLAGRSTVQSSQGDADAVWSKWAP